MTRRSRRACSAGRRRSHRSAPSSSLPSSACSSKRYQSCCYCRRRVVAVRRCCVRPLTRAVIPAGLGAHRLLHLRLVLLHVHLRQLVVLLPQGMREAVLDAREDGDETRWRRVRQRVRRKAARGELKPCGAHLYNTWQGICAHASRPSPHCACNVLARVRVV